MPTPTPSTEALALRVLRLLPPLHRWAAATVQAKHWGQGLSMRQLSVVSAMRSGVSSPGVLARRLMVTPAVITGLLDRLERQGYVRREMEADDRRRLRLVLTKTGMAVSDAVQQALTRELASHFQATDEELSLLGRALEPLERTLALLDSRQLPLGADDAEPEAPKPPARRVRTPARKRAVRKAAPRKSRP
jgi:DNA-binding MarR family transcriptional regulator